MSARPLLAVRDLHVHLGQSHVLQGVEFDVPEGGVTALLGRNGVGKTTTLRALIGLVDRRGSITLDGEQLASTATHRIVRRGVGYVPEDRDVFSGLTVEENLRLAERDGDARYDLVYDLFPELHERGRQRAGTLSGGQQQMLAIARALLNENRVLLVDEPTKGLAPLLVTEVADALERISRAHDGAARRAEPRRRRPRRARRRRPRHRAASSTSGPAQELLANERRRSTGCSASAAPERSREPMSTFVLLTITGLGLGALYFLIASGLSLIYGLMGVLNFAHGAFITVGAYAIWFTESKLDSLSICRGSSSARSSASSSARSSRRSSSSS